MKAIRVDETGPPENLTLVDVPIPEVGNEDILIKVALAGLIYADTEQRRGSYFYETTLPHYPGRELAGTIVSTGNAVRDFRPDQRVVGLIHQGGCYAEYVVVHAADPACADLHVLPDHVSFEQGLVYVTNFRLAYLLQHFYVGIPPSATVLVHGAAGGFGSVSVQIALANGTRVIGLCRTSPQVEYCQSIGLEHVIDVDMVDYVDAVLQLTGDEGVDYSLNGVGGATLDRDPLALKAFGEMIIYGYAAGKTKLDILSCRKCITVKNFIPGDFIGTPVFNRVDEAMHDWFNSQQLLEVNTIFALEDAAEAHSWLEQGRAIGKLALKP